MPEYKTPIRVHRDQSKAIGQKLGRYKLPFQKDEPVEEREFQVIQEGRLSMKITSQSKLNKVEKRSVYKKEESSWAERGSMVGNENDLSSERVEGTQLQMDGISQVQEVSTKKKEKEETTENHSVSQLPTPVTQMPVLVQREEKEVQVQQNKKQSGVSEVLSSLQKRRRFYSAQGDYEEDENVMADHSVLVRQTQQLPQKIAVPRLPIIGERGQRSRKKANSVQKDQSQLWGAISAQIERSRNQSQTRRDKRKKSMSRAKLQKLSSSQQDNECEAIGRQLKKKQGIEGWEGEESSVKEDMYASLEPIREETAEQVGEGKGSKQKRATFLQQIKVAIDLQEQKLRRKQFSLEQYMESYVKIREVNPFFRKLNQFGGCVMLSAGRLKIIQAGSVLFTEGEPITHISIIILGKVILTQTYNPIRRYALTGQSLGEEALFDESKPYSVRVTNTSNPVFHKLQARAYNRVCLLRIKLGKYYKVSQELNAIGEKLLFNLIDNLFRINYIKKEATLHQQVRNRLQTETLLKPKRKPSHFFFH